jgi:hypothetical protein
VAEHLSKLEEPITWAQLRVLDPRRASASRQHGFAHKSWAKLKEVWATGEVKRGALLAKEPRQETLKLLKSAYGIGRQI